MIESNPRYPDIRVAVASGNPLVWVSAVRLALRQAGAGHGAIESFSREAFATDATDGLSGVRRACRRWVEVADDGASER